MKLGRLANLEKVELEDEAKELEKTISYLEGVLASESAQVQVIRDRLADLVKKFGDARRTEVTDVVEEKEDKEIANVEPEKCVVVMTEGGLIKRIPTSSFREQKKGGKGIKNKDDIISTIIRTNTIDSLMIFTNTGNMYRLLVDNIPVGNNTTKGVSVRGLINIQPDEEPTIIYSIYRDTKAKYVLFVTKAGVAKKTPLEEYVKTTKKTGVMSLKLREGDTLAAAALVNDEDIVITSKNGMAIRFKSSEVSATGRATIGLKGIDLKKDDEVVSLTVIRDNTDDFAVFTADGYGKRMPLSELTLQKRAGKGNIIIKDKEVVDTAMLNDDDSILAVGVTNSICISAKEVNKGTKVAQGTQIIKGTRLQGVSKV